MRRATTLGVLVALASLVTVACARAQHVTTYSTTTRSPPPTAPLESATSTSTPFLRASWTTRVAPPGVGILNDVVCPSVSHCYAVGGSSPYGTGPGSIIASTDGGITWKTLDVTPDIWLASIACPSSTNCIAAGGTAGSGGETNAPVVLVTTDGGQVWSQTKLPAEEGGLLDIACPSAGTCIAVGSGLARTTDGGTTWSVESDPKGFSTVDAVTCPTSSSCLLGGAGLHPPPTSGSLSSVSHDAGATWSAAVMAGGFVGLFAASCTGVEHCVGLLGSDATNSYGTGDPVVTFDGGTTWRQGSRVVGQSVSCIGSTCISVGADSVGPTSAPATAFVSTDSGLHWSPMSISSAQSLDAVTCPTATDCIAVGGTFPGGPASLIVTLGS